MCFIYFISRLFCPCLLHSKENSRPSCWWSVPFDLLHFSRPNLSIPFTATPSRRLLVAILTDSWVFIFSSALMTSGIGLSLNSTICGGAIFLCIVFYGLSKVLIYMFLGEPPLPLTCHLLDSHIFYHSQPNAFTLFMLGLTVSNPPPTGYVLSSFSVLASSSPS